MNETFAELRNRSRETVLVNFGLFFQAHVARHVSSLAREQQHQRARVTVDDAAQFTDDRDEDHIQPAHDAFSLSTPTDDTQGCPSFEDELTDAVLCRNHVGFWFLVLYLGSLTLFSVQH